MATNLPRIRSCRTRCARSYPPLQAIAAGSRDRSLAEKPELDYPSAAELLVLIDVLEAGAEPAASS